MEKPTFSQLKCIFSEVRGEFSPDLSEPYPGFISRNAKLAIRNALNDGDRFTIPSKRRVKKIITEVVADKK